MGRALSILRIGFRTLKVAFFLLFFGGAALIIWKTLNDHTLLTRYRANGVPVVRELESKTGEHAITKLMEMEGPDGEKIPFRMRVPLRKKPDGSVVGEEATDKALGVLVINYGIGQNLQFFDRIAHFFDHGHVVVIMPEQYNAGLRAKKPRSIFRRFFGARERPARLVSETRMLIDYAESLPYVNPQRIDYMGISYGGIVGCALLAQEPRIKGAVLVMSGGDLSLLLGGLAERYRSGIDKIRPALVDFGVWWLSPFEPLDHIAAAQQERLLFLQVEPDELISLAARQRLYEAAAIEKEEKVYPGPHGPPPKETIAKMFRDTLFWLGYWEWKPEAPASAVSQPVSTGGDPAVTPE